MYAGCGPRGIGTSEPAHPESLFQKIRYANSRRLHENQDGGLLDVVLFRRVGATRDIPGNAYHVLSHRWVAGPAAERLLASRAR